MECENLQDGTRALSTRSLSAILTLRQRTGTEPLPAQTLVSEPLVPNGGTVSSRWVGVDDGELLEQLEVSTAAADEVLRRVEVALKASGIE